MDNNELKKIIEQVVTIESIEEAINNAFEKSKIIEEGVVSFEKMMRDGLYYSFRILDTT